jgi:hypothetical protein
MDRSPLSLEASLSPVSNVSEFLSLASQGISRHQEDGKEAIARVLASRKSWPRMTREEAEALGDEELRLEVRFRWKGSIREFCRKIRVKEGEFKSWLSRRYRSHPASSGGVRAWLVE